MGDKPNEPREGIRSWYNRTTRKAVRAVFGASVFAAAIAVAGFFLVPRDATLHLQIFNGAWTIPAFGGIWLAAFIFIWLIPMREVSFRGQESMERMEGRVASVSDDAKLVIKKMDTASDEMILAAKEFRQLVARMNTVLDKDPVGQIKSAVSEAADRLETVAEKYAPDGGPDIGRGIATLRAAALNRPSPAPGGNGAAKAEEARS